MGTEISEPTRNKPHRSQPSDDDSENPSKRRKHHSHKHHHHRHHRHSRRSKDEGKAELPNDDAGGDHTVPQGSIPGIDHDHMEEGEIVESSRDHKYSTKGAKERDHSLSRHDGHHSRKNRDRDREGSRDRHRERKRDRCKDRYKSRDEDNSRHSKYNDNGDFSRHDDDHRRRSDKDAKKTKADLPERDSDKSMRDEDEQEDYLAENEEDELEKIKEESRRRRQAILEKYESKNLQQVQLEEQPTENEKEEHPPLTDVKSPPHPHQKASEKHSDASNDMFCDDIFGESPCKPVKRNGLAVDQHDNWDDVEGYYSYRFGEVIDGRYEIIAAHGKGVFSTVVRAKDLKANLDEPKEVAIKFIRNNDTMLKAGMEELVILNKLAGVDPENKCHCVRFLSSFKYRNHLCLVFESLHMNLREVVKKFGRNIGLKLTAVRAYAKQLFIALKHLRECGVLHCDIKPDNMLVNEGKNILKLCDFGNAMFSGTNEVTPYLVSRFYRSPEVILGLSYDYPMDMWSVGCCLFELYTGDILFPGKTNNDMLRLHMELKGLFPNNMVRDGAFRDQHFDQKKNFLAIVEDPVTKKPVRRAILNVKPKGFGTRILASPGEDRKMLASFKDLLENIFTLDPKKRINAEKALSHPFITGK